MYKVVLATIFQLMGQVSSGRFLIRNLSFHPLDVIFQLRATVVVAFDQIVVYVIIKYVSAHFGQINLTGNWPCRNISFCKSSSLEQCVLINFKYILIRETKCDNLEGFIRVQ
jgi:hypothetical protein